MLQPGGAARPGRADRGDSAGAARGGGGRLAHGRPRRQPAAGWRRRAALPPALRERIDRLVELVPAIEARRHRESLRGAVQRVLPCARRCRRRSARASSRSWRHVLDLAMAAAARIDELERRLAGRRPARDRRGRAPRSARARRLGRAPARDQRAARRPARPLGARPARRDGEARRDARRAARAGGGLRGGGGAVNPAAQRGLVGRVRAASGSATSGCGSCACRTDGARCWPSWCRSWPASRRCGGATCATPSGCATWTRRWWPR